MSAMGPYAGKESQTERWTTERVFFDGPDFPVVLPLVVEPEGADESPYKSTDNQPSFQEGYIKIGAYRRRRHQPASDSAYPRLQGRLHHSSHHPHRPPLPQL